MGGLIQSHRRGSALLIVLGMMAFMVVSAVAFSAYMRASRLPSSYLRQTVASRLLVKAALANAIDEIDAAIGNFPHPGVWHAMSKDNVATLSDALNLDERTGSRGSRYTKRKHNSNAWIGRVYIGGTNDVNMIQQRLVDQSSTVSTLCMEALAYIPPPLVNEARYYSRRSPAAQWHQMNFDSGRYAFCALDVSDYFDVNALHADIARSSDPDCRISLAHLFENDDHTSAKGNMGTPKAWDDFMKNFRGEDNKVPLVSMADFNLALNEYKPTGWGSPFCNYILNDSGNFYNLTDEKSSDADKIRRMSFVTDGYFPKATTTDSEQIDLADADGQPFTKSLLDNQSPNYYTVTESSTKGAKQILKYAPNIALASLYDYLDEDYVPLSLSIPTTERVAMVCGLQLEMPSATLKVVKQQGQQRLPSPTPPNSSTAPFKALDEQMYLIDAASLFSGMPSVTAILTYPFRHKDGIPDNPFIVDGGIALFLAEDGKMGLRPSAAVSRLRFTDNALFSGATPVSDGVIIIPFQQKEVRFNSVENENDAVKKVELVAEPGSSVFDALKNNPLLKIPYQWTATPVAPVPPSTTWDWDYPTLASVVAAAQTDPGVLHYEGDDGKAECLIKPLDDRANVLSAYGATGDRLINGLPSTKVQLYIAVFVRVKYQNKTVDLVPACGENDKLIGSDNWSEPQSQVLLQENFGNATPLMKFDTGATFVFNVAGLDAASSGSSITISPANGVMVADPRFNHAPESWFISGNAVSETSWLSENQAKNRDGDIFMQVSDQGYLQSVYELGNILRFGTDPSGAGSGFGDIGDSERGKLRVPNTWTMKTFPASFSDTVNSHVMWKTYDPFERYNTNGGDGFEKLQMVNDNGFKINPYSDNKDILMAAFANTPHDWRCASTNNNEIGDVDVSRFIEKYSWNGLEENTSGAKLAWTNLQEVAAAFIDDMKNANGDTWEDVWQNLGWYSSGQKNPENYILEGLPLKDGSSKLYNTDKKFLYGFWHDCFAVKQQLFLVFVRAEPAMMGGGAINQTPPQLGARAVALVWRDPTATVMPGSNLPAPHRTRILFYRQFD